MLGEILNKILHTATCRKCGCILAFKTRADQFLPNAIGRWFLNQLDCPEKKWEAVDISSEQQLVDVSQARMLICRQCEYFIESKSEGRGQRSKGGCCDKHKTTQEDLTNVNQ